MFIHTLNGLHSPELLCYYHWLNAQSAISVALQAPNGYGQELIIREESV